MDTRWFKKMMYVSNILVFGSCVFTGYAYARLVEDYERSSTSFEGPATIYVQPTPVVEVVPKPEVVSKSTLEITPTFNEANTSNIDELDTVTKSVGTSFDIHNEGEEVVVEDIEHNIAEIYDTSEDAVVSSAIVEAVDNDAESNAEMFEHYDEVDIVPFPPEENKAVDGPHLTKQSGVFQGPSGKETFYNLNMSGVISIMRNMGYSEDEYPYWVRDDGVKMFGYYVMCAAELSTRPKGTILETSLGLAIVVDTGGFAYSNPTQVDIAVTW